MAHARSRLAAHAGRRIVRLATRRSPFVRPRIGVIHGEIIKPQSRIGQRRLVDGAALAARPRRKCNDDGAHDNSSHTAMAKSPTSASEIRVAAVTAVTVMPDVLMSKGKIEKRGTARTPWRAARLGARTLISRSRAAAGRVRARRQSFQEGRTTARFDGASQNALRRDYCARRPPSDFGNRK